MIVHNNYFQPTLKATTVFLNLFKKLHDYRYLGETFRERQQIRRRIERLKTRIENLPPLERNALLTALYR